MTLAIIMPPCTIETCFLKPEQTDCPGPSGSHFTETIRTPEDLVRYNQRRPLPLPGEVAVNDPSKIITYRIHASNGTMQESTQTDPRRWITDGVDLDEVTSEQLGRIIRIDLH